MSPAPLKTKPLRRIVLAIVALVFVAVAAPTCATYRRDIDRAYTRVATGSQIAQTRCGPIEYASAGAGPPVLLVHGAGGGFDQGLELGEALARAGFRVIAPSRFGYLRTPLPAQASAAAQADAHACLLDALNVPRAAIMGVSAGGPSTLQFAVRHPDRTLAVVLLVPGVYAPPLPTEARSARLSRAAAFLLDATLRSDFIFWAGSRLAPDTFIRSVLGTPPEVAARASADERARLRLVLDHILPVRPRRPGLLNDATIVSSVSRDALESISAPTLAISTADDLYGTFEAARYTAEHVPHGRFLAYPSGGHMLVGHTAETAAEIASFLQGAARF
jgi:2-hydroxy-6-oxonona-2,4-dienedioate hydrolase